MTASGVLIWTFLFQSTFPESAATRSLAFNASYWNIKFEVIERWFIYPTFVSIKQWIKTMCDVILHSNVIDMIKTSMICRNIWVFDILNEKIIKISVCKCTLS